MALPVRFARTLLSSLVALPRFARAMPGDAGLSAPLSYAFLTAAPAMICTAMVWARNGDSASGVVFAAAVLLQLLAYPVYLGLWSLALYVSARVLGVSGVTYRALLRVVCYASALNGLVFITFLPWSAMPAALYTAVVCVACIAAAGRVSVPRAFAVYVMTVFLGLLAYVSLVMLAIMNTDS